MSWTIRKKLDFDLFYTASYKFGYHTIFTIDIYGKVGDEPKSIES